MPLQRRAPLLLRRFLSTSASLRSPSEGPLESSTRRFYVPSPPRKSKPPFAPHSPKLFSCPTCSDRGGGRRGLCGGAPAEEDYSKEVDEINLKFVEAREEIDAALESKDTVYFDEEAECARAAVKVALDMFEGLLRRLPEKERATLQRSMGLKMEQLKAELAQLDE